MAQVDGNVEIRGPGGPPDITPYLALLVKQDGKWLFDSVRDLSSEPDEEELPASERLKALEWMVGEWRQKRAALSSREARAGTRTATSYCGIHGEEEGDEEVMSVTQRIGWDPQAGGFRSWIFDSESGYAQGRWEPEGKAWVIQQTGVLPGRGDGIRHGRADAGGPGCVRLRMTNRREGGRNSLTSTSASIAPPGNWQGRPRGRSGQPRWPVGPLRGGPGEGEAGVSTHRSRFPLRREDTRLSQLSTRPTPRLRTRRGSQLRPDVKPVTLVRRRAQP